METIKTIWFDDKRIYMQSNEGKQYSRPLEAFPVLKEANLSERMNYEITMNGTALRWKSLDEDIHISSFHHVAEPDYDNDIARIFNRFPQLNVSEVARSMGINKSLLAKYIYGIIKPSEERTQQLRDALHLLGESLMAV